MPRQKKAKRNDGRFQIKRVVGHNIDGRPIIKSFYGKNKEEAWHKYQTFLRDYEKKQEEKRLTPFAPWVEKWLYTYKEPDVKPTTFLTTYKRPCQNYIIPYFKDSFLQEISQVDIKKFLNGLTHLSQSLINKIILCLKGIFDAAIDNDYLTKNPCRNISCRSQQKKEEKRTYDGESVDALCASDHKYGLLVHILLRMGLRCSELCGLRWEDINFNEGTMSISQALTVENGAMYIDKPKSQNSTRRLHIPEDLLDRLKEEQGSGYIAMLNDRHITPNHFGDRQMEAFYNAMQVPADQRLSPHELRHTCGTLLYEKTKDIYFVSRFLGHSDINITTKIYVHSEMQQNKVHINFPCL